MMQSTYGQQSLGRESQPEAETEPFGVEVVVVLGLPFLGLTVAPSSISALTFVSSRSYLLETFLDLTSPLLRQLVISD